MRKLAVVVMMLALAMFMASVASAQDRGSLAIQESHHHIGWAAIQGTYEMVATGTCLHSTGGFTISGSGTPLDPTVATPLGDYFVSSYVGQGTFVFEGDGTGTMRVTQSCILPNKATQAVAPPNSAPPAPFTYQFGHDGTIIVTIPAVGLELSGRISMDHKTMTLVSAMQHQLAGPTGHQICDIARVLIRVPE